MTDSYRSFLEAKVVATPMRGFDVTPEDVNPRCQPHVRAIVPWMVRLGRAACFSRFGLQKTVTQLEAVRLTRARAGGRGLIVCPLGVRQEFRRDAVERLGWGLPPKFIRTTEEAESPEGIYLTNYESVREGKILQPQSWHPDVWTDITRMRTLNMVQARRGAEMHLCPLQFDIAFRLIDQLSMEGEEVFDPFAGLGTVPYCAIKRRRRGRGVELSPVYFADAVAHCAAAARDLATPSLFDLVDDPAAVEVG